MTEDAKALRNACGGYPRDVVIEALDVALASVESEPHERRELAAIVAAWVADHSALTDPPPVAESVIDKVRSHLRARAH